jgi:hypothetical protein
MSFALHKHAALMQIKMRNRTSLGMATVSE